MAERQRGTYGRSGYRHPPSPKPVKRKLQEEYGHSRRVRTTASNVMGSTNDRRPSQWDHHPYSSREEGYTALSAPRYDQREHVRSSARRNEFHPRGEYNSRFREPSDRRRAQGTHRHAVPHETGRSAGRFEPRTHSPHHRHYRRPERSVPHYGARDLREAGGTTYTKNAEDTTHPRDARDARRHGNGRYHRQTVQPPRVERFQVPVAAARYDRRSDSRYFDDVNHYQRRSHQHHGIVKREVDDDPYLNKSGGRDSGDGIPTTRGHDDVRVSNVGGHPPIWIVFDLNGTLTATAQVRKVTKSVQVRPNIRALLRLKERMPVVRLAAWSSAVPHNVTWMIATIEKEVGVAPNSLFERILNRTHCHPAPVEKRVKKWDTVKPLSPYFGDLRRVLIVEDTSNKSVPGEEANLVHLPQWELDPNDNCLVTLVDALCDALDKDQSVNAQYRNLKLEQQQDAGSNEAIEFDPKAGNVDVRLFTASVTQTVRQDPKKSANKDSIL